MSLESKHYLASPTEVEAITHDVLDARSTVKEGRSTYLQILIATTQDALGIPPRQRAVATGKLSAESVVQQRVALETVHKKLSVSVGKAAREFLGAKCTPKTLNAATNFARTSMSTLRAWIKVGNDITGLVPGRVTKASLAVAAAKKRVTSPKVLSNRVRKYGDRFMLTVAKLSESDTAVARRALENVKVAVDQALSKMNAAGREGQERRSTRSGLHVSA